MDKTFYIKFWRLAIEISNKYLTHTLKDVISITKNVYLDLQSRKRKRTYIVAFKIFQIRWQMLLQANQYHPDRVDGANYGFKVDQDHYCDVKMGAMASPINSLTIVYSTVYLGVDQRKHQSSAWLASLPSDTHCSAGTQQAITAVWMTAFKIPITIKRLKVRGMRTSCAHLQRGTYIYIYIYSAVIMW